MSFPLEWGIVRDYTLVGISLVRKY